MVMQSAMSLTNSTLVSKYISQICIKSLMRINELLCLFSPVTWMQNKESRK